MDLFLLNKEIASYTSKSSGSLIDAFGQLIFLIVVFAGVLALAYFSTRYIGKMRIKTLTGQNIKVIESMNLGIGSAIHLVKAGKQYFLVSQTKERVELISEINSENIDELPKEEDLPFEKVMKEYMNKFGRRKK